MTPSQKWYRKNKDEHKANIYEKRAQLRQAVAVLLRGLRCSKCPEDHPACMEFHHRDPAQKDFSIGRAINACMPIEAIAREIKKCDVLCSNCHRKLHWRPGS